MRAAGIVIPHSQMSSISKMRMPSFTRRLRVVNQTAAVLMAPSDLRDNSFVPRIIPREEEGARSDLGVRLGVRAGRDKGSGAEVGLMPVSA